MMTDREENIPEVDLVFLDYPLRKTASERIGLTLVCPHEVVDNRKNVTPNCGTCGFCWKK